MNTAVSAKYMKTCTKCKVEKLLSQFHAQKASSDGKAPWCKDCRNANTIQYYNERGGRENRAKHKTSSSAGVKASDHAYFLWAKRFAAQRGLEFLVSEAEYCALVVNPCNYCLLPIKHTGGRLDRLDNTRGYTLDNVVPCCKICNQARSDAFTPDEMKIIGATIRQVLLARN